MGGLEQINSEWVRGKIRPGRLEIAPDRKMRGN
jgi:hypothetical protein